MLAKVLGAVFTVLFFVLVFLAYVTYIMFEWADTCSQGWC